MLTEGWRQIRAGIALITWSRLASWDAEALQLVAAEEREFESPAGHGQVHTEFGRLICWIAFGVGSEYLAKGACLVKGRKLAKSVPVIRSPTWDENVEGWVRLVNAGDPSIDERDVSFGTLGNVPVADILPRGAGRDLVAASFKYLAKTIRNRDAHRYARSVRAFHSHTVERLFVPAFNLVLASLDQGDFRRELSGVAGQ